MKKTKQEILVFGISLIVSYLLVGYFIHTMLISIDWVETATIWHKINEYYIVSFRYNIIPSLVMSAMITGSYILFKYKLK